jgi:FtsP/CotA-like multicopper oxidase with cupredoxin domain
MIQIFFMLICLLAPTRGHAMPVARTHTPHVPSLPFKMDGKVKVFHLIAEPVRREFSPGLVVNTWGYNGSSPGPTLEATEGETVRILVTNKLPEATSVHWHGVLLPSGMDGVAGLNQPAIAPGETYVYEFPLRQHGTQMYHPHSDEMTQMALGMMGFFIIHPRQEPRPVHRDYAIFLHEWDVPPGAATPNPITMTDFNLFTFNGRVYPGIEPLLAQRGERVRIRLANLSMDSHPIHLHGLNFVQTGTDGGPTPLTAQFPETTVNVPPGATRDIEFVADEPGDWAMHCHKSHHTMNQMGHDVPNMLGVKQGKAASEVRKLLPDYMAMGESGMGDMAEMRMDAPENTIPMMSGDGPFGSVQMGGMFTIVKVRPRLDAASKSSWWPSPAHKQAKLSPPQPHPASTPK